MVKVPILVVHSRYIRSQTVFSFLSPGFPPFPVRMMQSGKVFDRATSHCVASPRHPRPTRLVVLLVSRRMQIDAPGSARKPAIYPFNPSSFSELPPRRRDKSRASRRYCAYLSGPHLERKAYLRRRHAPEGMEGREGIDVYLLYSNPEQEEPLNARNVETVS